MNAPHPTGNHPPYRRAIWILALLALPALVLALWLWSGKAPSGITPPITQPRTADRPSPQPPPPTLSDRIRAAIDSENDPRGLARAEALRALGDDLLADETAALLAKLLSPRDPEAPPGPHSLAFHETALVLQKQEPAHEKFADTLATVARDTRRDHVIRDYAIQHLTQLWHLAGPSLAPTIEATLLEIADEAPSMLPSALLGLHLLGSNQKSSLSNSPPRAVADEQFAPRLISMLDPAATTSEAAQMTAIRIVGERQLPGFGDDLARIAADPTSGHTLVRMAAVAAIARFGDSRDLTLLRNIDRTDPRLASAIDHAINRIESIQ